VQLVQHSVTYKVYFILLTPILSSKIIIYKNRLIPLAILTIILHIEKIISLIAQSTYYSIFSLLEVQIMTIIYNLKNFINIFVFSIQIFPMIIKNEVNKKYNILAIMILYIKQNIIV